MCLSLSLQARRIFNADAQLFSAGDTIQVLNRHTPQLLSIVTSLQDSFSSISQLVDSVALPDSAMHAATNREDIDGQRLALMLQAEGGLDSSRIGQG